MITCLFIGQISQVVGPIIQFSSPNIAANENVGSMQVSVSRTGDTSATSSVDYATSDAAGSNPCSTNTGAASSRCDYLRTLGTLIFAAGETNKTLLIPIVDDVFMEGPETFTITLSNPTGAALGANAAAALTINDGGTEAGANPIDTAGFFVRQHYIDFLNREPEPPGFGFWSNEIDLQYFGYLRRNPNDFPEPGSNFDGYNFWLGKLNEFNGNFVQAEMVKAFITSIEYRQRFAP